MISFVASGRSASLVAQREQVVEPVGLEQPIPTGAEGNEQLIVGAPESGARSLRLQRADDLELHPADAHVLSDDRVWITNAEHRQHARAKDGDALTADVLAGGEHSSAIDR